MQKYNKNTSWFTLVELIIVITILSILATIGFTSFQWYTADARDTKRTSDLSSLIGALEAKRAWNSLSIVSFVDSKVNSSLSWAFNLAWKSTTWTWTNYNAWIMNFSLLWISATSFQDPKWFDYSFWATTFKNWAYQFAAVVENWETPMSVVKWNYAGRKQENILITASSRNNTMFDMKNTNDYVKLLVWDTVVAGSGGTVCTVTAGSTIQSISSDLKTVTLSWSINTTADCNIRLWSWDETLWLIWDYNNTTTPTQTSAVIDKSTTTLAY